MERYPTGLLDSAARHAAAYLDGLAKRPVIARRSSDDLRRTLGAPLAAEGTSPHAVVEQLAEAAFAGTVASAGPRYYGFVVGGSVPAALAADWLVSAWDQNSAVHALSPLVAVIEEITASWLKNLAGLPQTMSVGFVTGCQMASFTALAAARHRVLRKAGWDVEADGLIGAPPIDVVVSDEAHYTIFMALRLLGLGANRVTRIPTDGQGRMRADALARVLRERTAPCIVCAQAGNVNTGAFDPIADIAQAARERGVWLHVDGAFGLWAALSREHAALVRGVEQADSVGDRRAQVAQRPLRLWHRVLRRRGSAPRRDVAGGCVYRGVSARARFPRVRAGRVPSRPRRQRLRGAARARS